MAIAHFKGKSYQSGYEVFKEIKSLCVWGMKRGSLKFSLLADNLCKKKNESGFKSYKLICSLRVREILD